MLPADTLLDAGCGDGRFLAAIARSVNAPARLVGSDISERILETAAETVRREGVEPELVRANLEHLPFDDASFDRVLSFQVIEHLLDPAAGVRELVRVLKPNGWLILSTDNAKSTVSRLLNAPRTAVVRTLRLTGRHAAVSFPHGSFTRTEVLAMLQAADVHVEHAESFRFHLDGVSSPAIQRTLNRVDRALPGRGWGDIIAFVARKA
jgi:2-polyprenyl-3-methyl-5-hydroxy-6-metoxy-1,4-benzoquinol methylase